MDASGQNYKDTFRYTDVEYTPDGHTDVYRWDDFLGIAGGHVYSAMDTIDMVSTGGQYEGDEPEHAYACEVVGCCGLSDGVALFRPVSHDGADLIQIAFLRNDVDDATGAYTERFEAGSFDLPAADLPRSESRVDLLEYFSGRSFKHTPGVNRGLDPREAVDSIEDAIGCDLGLFDGFWLGVPGEADMRVGPYTKKSLLDFSYYAKELSCRYGLADSDILEIARHLPEDCPDRLAAVKAYLDCEYVPDGNASNEKAYRWGDFLDIAGGNARYAAMLIDRTSPGEPEEGLHPETLVDQDIRETETFTLAGRPIAPEDIYDLPRTVHGLYKELTVNVDRSGRLVRDWRGFSAGADADDVLRAIEAAFGETEYSRAGTVLGAYADDTFMSSFYLAQDAARDVTPLTPWEDEDGVAFLSRTLDAGAGATVEKVVNDPVTPFERSFREDIFNMPQNRPVGLAVLATLPLDAFLDASLSMICRGEGENAGTFTVKPGTYEPILGIYDPVGGCGGTMGTVLDCDFEIDPHDIAYTMMEPVRGEWKSDRIDLYTPQDCFGFSDPFGGRIEYSEKKPEIAVAVKPDPVELGHRASVAASSTAGGRARGAGIRQ
ncbi:hypothetical protein [Slackia isoflavoniconvertens]|uniref:Uncharacterized protein n=1 Tax=Slackia isoflavoniconvertens TaxID=572010 RepID=A0A369LNA1_9ACTN|nr:hypothetical protein [Slackia isoflavoniconvertens]RDB61051.1 hypothetical protein C1881_00540 [Slackia isoflavoniconvertens]